LALAVSLCAARSIPVQPPEVRRFPISDKSYHPFDVKPCAGGDALFFWSTISEEHFVDGLYAYDLATHKIKEIFRGRFGSIWPAPVPHLLVVDMNGGDGRMSTLLVVKEDGTVLGKLHREPSEGFYWPVWSPDGKYIAYQSDELTEADSYGFKAIGLMNVTTGKSREFSTHGVVYMQSFLKLQNDLFLCAGLRRTDDLSHQKYAVYDLRGQRADVSDEQAKGCDPIPDRYYTSAQEEVPMPFTIREAGSGRVLKSFPASDPSTGDILVASDWNPVYDDYVLVYWSKGGGSFNTEKVGVYSVSQKKFVLIEKCSSFSWSADGKELIFYRNGEFIFERVGQ